MMSKNKKGRGVAGPTKSSPVVDTVEETEEKKGPKRNRHPMSLRDHSCAEIPGDYDWDKHKPFMKVDFTHEYTWFEFRAIDLERRAAKFRKDAETSRTLGSGADRLKAKTLVKLVGKVADLKLLLERKGVNVEELLEGLDTETEEA